MDDRRTQAREPSPRHPMDPRLLCSLTVAGRIDRAPAVLLEASAAGAGLYVRDRFETGEPAALEPAGGGWPGGPIPVRVAHVSEEPAGFRVGVNFLTPLTDAELAALLGEPPPA